LYLNRTTNDLYSQRLINPVNCEGSSLEYVLFPSVSHIYTDYCFTKTFMVCICVYMCVHVDTSLCLGSFINAIPYVLWNLEW